MFGQFIFKVATLFVRLGMKKVQARKTNLSPGCERSSERGIQILPPQIRHNQRSLKAGLVHIRTCRVLHTNVYSPIIPISFPTLCSFLLLLSFLFFSFLFCARHRLWLQKSIQAAHPEQLPCDSPFLLLLLLLLLLCSWFQDLYLLWLLKKNVRRVFIYRSLALPIEEKNHSPCVARFIQE